MEKVVVTKAFHGLLGMQVCSEKNASDEEILEVCNRENKCGTTNGWSYVVRNDEEYPQSNPIQCEDHSDRLHFLVGC